jgi:hypothetical protein
MADQLQPLALIETGRRQIADYREIVGPPAAVAPSAMRSRRRNSLKGDLGKFDSGVLRTCSKRDFTGISGFRIGVTRPTRMPQIKKKLTTCPVLCNQKGHRVDKDRREQATELKDLKPNSIAVQQSPISALLGSIFRIHSCFRG